MQFYSGPLIHFLSGVDTTLGLGNAAAALTLIEGAFGALNDETQKHWSTFKAHRCDVRIRLDYRIHGIFAVAATSTGVLQGVRGE